MIPQARKNGMLGEVLASRELRRQGYVLREANFRTRMGEVDLIAEKNGTMVFCEVKTRTPSAVSLPREAVDDKKQRRIVAAALQYIKLHKFRGPVRFDVIEVYLLPDGVEPRIVVLENAFQTDQSFGFGV